MKNLAFSLILLTAPAAMIAQGVSGADRMKGQEPKTAATNSPTDKPSMTGPAESNGSWTNEEILPLTVHEAWVQSGRNEDKFFDMVKQMAELSATKRGLTLPESEAAGQKAGDWIKKEAKKDPDQLLYVVVDRAVVKVGTKTTVASK